MAGDEHLPTRYCEPWFRPWDERLEAALRAGASVLDVGAGRRPSVAAGDRREVKSYVGLDTSEAELREAPPGSYDEVVVADVASPVPALEGRFALIISYQVLEHVRRLDLAVDNLRRYLRPGGTLVAQLSGTFSAFGIANKALPKSLSARLVKGLYPVETFFPAYYHRCTDRGLRRTFAQWSALEILPRYNGARYFSFARPLQRAYLGYENWAERNAHASLATHYLLTASR